MKQGAVWTKSTAHSITQWMRKASVAEEKETKVQANGEEVHYRKGKESRVDENRAGDK